MPVSVLIVDDHPAFRASARTVLELDGFEVVAEAADGATALELARVHAPDVVLLDIALADMTGFKVAERLAGSRSRVVLTSSREASDYGRRVRESPAPGFVPKDRLSGPALYGLLGRLP